MRLFLLPINSRNTLIYAQRLNQQLTSQQTRVERISAKASERWLKWESYEKGWQKRVTIWGNQLFARIPYQEWGLKSIPPLSARKPQDELKDNEKVQILFPGKTLPESQVPNILRKLATERQAFHRQRMIWTILGMPLTAPFALVPVIPNLPFFYMAFRAWSHWKALAGSKHVTYLLENKLVQYSPSAILQQIYDLKDFPLDRIEPTKESLKDKTDLDDRANAFRQVMEKEQLPKAIDVSPDNDTLLASKSTGHLVSLAFGLPQVDAEIERALEQVTKQVTADKLANTSEPLKAQNEKKNE